MSEDRLINSTDVIKYTFPNGSEFSGTFDELKEVAKALKQPLTGLKVTQRGYYNSATDGLIAIKEMHSHHIRRTLLKETNSYMGKVFQKGDSNTSFLKKYGGLVENSLVQDLLNELVRRGDDPAKEPESAKKVISVSAAVSPAPASKKSVKPVKAAAKKAAPIKVAAKKSAK